MIQMIHAREIDLATWRLEGERMAGRKGEREILGEWSENDWAKGERE
jgi:hypothetical protein